VLAAKGRVISVAVMVQEHGLPVLAIDLGGTKIISAVVSADNQVLLKDYCLTLADEGQTAVINRIFSGIDTLLGQTGLLPSQMGGISLAAAGAIDSARGLITVSPNLPGWRDVPLRDILKGKYGIDTFLINDANAAALGEYGCGAGVGVNNLIYVTVSTGIGGGIIIDGKLYSGACGSAGEIGHMTIDVNGPHCSCGNVGCLEMLASGTAVAKEAIERISRGESSSVTDIVRGKIQDITAKEVGMAAQDGDVLASEIIYKASSYLGIGLVNLVNIFNPEMIVVGGGMSKMGDLLLEPARQLVAARAMPLSAGAVRIVTAKLGEDSGVLGAAIFARQQKLI